LGKTSGDWVFGSNFFFENVGDVAREVGPSKSSCVVVDHRRSSSKTAVSEKIGRSVLAGLDFSATRILGDSILAPSDVHQVGLYRMCGVLQKYSADQNIRSHTVLHTVLSRFGRALHTALSRFQTPFQEQNEWRVGVRLKNFFENVGDVAREGWTVELIVCCRRPSTLLFDDGCLRKNWSL
jgi:hypothetical protein